MIGAKGEHPVKSGGGRRPGRKVVRTAEAPFQPYDLEGPQQPDISWLPVSYETSTGAGCYLMRMAPGAVTLPHHHPGMEEFLMLEGELIDDDGAVFGAGDFVSYAPGTFHNSRTETGCLIAVFEWSRQEPGADVPELDAPGQ